MASGGTGGLVNGIFLGVALSIGLDIFKRFTGG